MARIRIRSSAPKGAEGFERAHRRRLPLSEYFVDAAGLAGRPRAASTAGRGSPSSPGRCSRASLPACIGSSCWTGWRRSAHASRPAAEPAERCRRTHRPRTRRPGAQRSDGPRSAGRAAGPARRRSCWLNHPAAAQTVAPSRAGWAPSRRAFGVLRELLEDRAVRRPSKARSSSAGATRPEGARVAELAGAESLVVDPEGSGP